MNIIVFSLIWLVGEGLAMCISCEPKSTVWAVVAGPSMLSRPLSVQLADAVPVDIAQGIDLHDFRSIAADPTGERLIVMRLVV